MERHRNATSAFRSFDFKGKGKVKKAHLIEGFEDIKTSFVDNLSMKVVETRVQDNLAAERKAERDKIA